MEDVYIVTVGVIVFLCGLITCAVYQAKEEELAVVRRKSQSMEKYHSRRARFIEGIQAFTIIGTRIGMEMLVSCASEDLGVLPMDIYYRIVWHLRKNQEDVKNLRLVCKSFANLVCYDLDFRRFLIKDEYSQEQ